MTKTNYTQQIGTCRGDGHTFKTIISPGGRIVTRMFHNSDSSCACTGCHQTIKPDDFMQGCYSCNAIFCEACVMTGRFEQHTNNCEEPEPDDLFD